MKRVASVTSVETLNNQKDALFSHVPPKCGFSDDEGYARREFSKLPPNEQDRVVKDIYGIDDCAEEKPCFVKECLGRFEEELENIPAKRRKALEFARDEHTAFFEDEKLRLSFLRTEKYNAKLAARRLGRFLDKKKELFGSEKLSKKIVLEDLDDSDIETIRSGGFQPLPMRDRGGRLVFFTRHRNWKFKESRNFLRALWYLCMSVADEVDERQGVVIVSYEVGPFSADEFDRSVFKSAMDILKSMPIKLAGYHFCYDDIRFRMVWGLASVYIGKEARLRARDHEGTHVECRYGLMSYGIPVESMPISIDGAEDNENILKWMDERKSKEQNENDSEHI